MNKLVYSSDTGSHKKSGKQDAKDSSKGKGEGPIKIRIEKKGRGGKSVTVLFNLPLTKDEAKDLKKQLSSHLGTGSTFKDYRIEFQGDHVQKVLTYLDSNGIKALKAGG
ncbi:hypothetical protein N9W79_01315 [bacterium]|nr:hypothetical protein [bacterium]